ncbi:MAG: cupredoxin domain-containing protein [bacterium]
MNQFIRVLVISVAVITLFGLLATGGMMAVHAMSMGGSCPHMGSGHRGGGGMNYMGGMVGGLNGWMHGWMHDTSGQSSSVAAKRAENAQDETTTVEDNDVSNGSRVEFGIETTYDDGMSYRGTAGSIAGEINPTLTVKKGKKVRIRLRNSAGGPHDWAIPALNVETEVLNRRGDTTNISFKATNPGEYSYYCTVPGHRSAGMEGTFIIEKTDSTSS